MDNGNDLKKSLHRAIAKAIKSKSTHQSRVADSVIKDIEDPNSFAEVPSEEIPAHKEAVLHKDLTLKDAHKQKEAMAQAGMGMLKPPKPGQAMPGLKSPQPMGKMNASLMGSEAPNRGIEKLKKFVESVSMKKSRKYA